VKLGWKPGRVSASDEGVLTSGPVSTLGSEDIPWEHGKDRIVNWQYDRTYFLEHVLGQVMTFELG
jgi:hypothetical protein